MSNLQKPLWPLAIAVASVLETIPDRQFLVAGDTDDVPIHTARFPSNRELSTARAGEVTKFVIERGMHPQVLAAAGFGEFDPVAPAQLGRSAAARRVDFGLVSHRRLGLRSDILETRIAPGQAEIITVVRPGAAAFVPAGYRGDLTVADRAPRGGLALRDAEAGPRWLASERGGQLEGHGVGW